MDRKPVWINGRKVFVLPWARVWDALMAAPSSDFLDVWSGRAIVVNETGGTVCPDDSVRSGQKLFVRGKPARTGRNHPGLLQGTE